MATTVTVTTNTEFDENNPEAALTVSFVNSADIDYAASSSVVFTCTLTDGTTTLDYMFFKKFVTAGSIAATSSTPFTFDNASLATPLTGTITGSNGKIYYTPS